MTFSIAARCPETGALGIGIATSSPAVGSRCVHVMHGVGAIAHQATPEPRLARWGMRMLEMGMKAPKVLKELVDGDEHIEFRQIAIVDTMGNAVARTGAHNKDHSSHMVGEGFVALGNFLEGAHTVRAIHDAYLATKGEPFEERLMRAIEAGRDVGGQYPEGQTSAALLVYKEQAVAHVDLRVDHNMEPIAELRRLLEWFKPLLPFYAERCNNPRVGRHKDWLKARGIERAFGEVPPALAAARARGEGPPPLTAPLLEVEDLSVAFGATTVVDRVSFSIAPGETLALVGESGSGKSVTALALMRLLEPPGRVTSGTVRFAGQELTRLPEAAMRRIRGDRIAMVFQEPMASLNPVLSVGAHVTEPLRLHRGLDRVAARKQAIALLDRVGIPAAATRIDEYPHRLSGGMRQRVMIAAALACRPDLLIADEPTTALDVTIQAQILRLLAELQRDLGMAVLFITHDLGVVAEQAQRVAVMYAGRVVERAPTAALFDAPAHPYAAALLRCMPGEDATERLEAIEGTVPPPGRLPPGCRFAPRCALAGPDCDAADPPLRRAGPGHDAACIRVAA